MTSAAQNRTPKLDHLLSKVGGVWWIARQQGLGVRAGGYKTVDEAVAAWIEARDFDIERIGTGPLSRSRSSPE